MIHIYNLKVNYCVFRVRMIKYIWLDRKSQFLGKGGSLKTNYNLKKEVLENGCCNSLKKKSLSQWKISQLQKEYDFMLSGVNVFGEMAFTYKELEAVGEKLNKAKYFYDVANKELSIYSDVYIKEAEKVNNATYKRNTRLQQKAREIITTGRAIFLSLTFHDDIFKSMNKETRRRMITRFLKKTCKSYVANIDYGGKNGREHYHALVEPIQDKINEKDYRNMFPKSSIKFELVNLNKKQNQDIDITAKKIAKYTSKLTNHAIKETTQQNRIIYSKS